ncbi:NACHT, LRR and PYD domains-containing protein 10 [Dispira simplex]|nr:NACHT, LRR and PYD domains-containing protein 10 [Dispira simplex]
MVWGNGGDHSHMVNTWIERLQKQDATLTTLHIFTGRRLTDGQFARLFQAIRNNHVLTELGCSGHTLRAAALDALVDMLRTNTTLEKLKCGDSRQFGLSPAIFQRLAEALADNSGLRELDLEYKHLGLDNASALRLIVNRRMGWRNLKLGRNKLEDDTMAHIFAQPSSLDNDGSVATESTSTVLIDELDLSDNLIENNGTHSLCQWLKGSGGSTTLHTVRFLDLSYNALGPKGLQAVAEHLSSSTCQITQLWLVNTPFVGENHVLTNATEAERATWKRLGKALGENKSLRELKLDSCCLEDEGLVLLSQELVRNSTLERFSLRDNRISDVGARLLSDALSIPQDESSANHDPLSLVPQVRMVDLSENLITPAGLAYLLQCPKLEELVLYANRAALNGPVEELVNGDNADRLRRLDLSCNEISASGFQWFSEALVAGLLPTLAILEVAGNVNQDEIPTWQPSVDHLKTQRPTLKIYWKRFENAMQQCPERPM